MAKLTPRLPRWKDVRDIVLFLGGMAGLYHEVVLTTAERPTLLLMFAAMMGLPAFLRTDEKDPPNPREEGTQMMRQATEEEKTRWHR